MIAILLSKLFIGSHLRRNLFTPESIFRDAECLRKNATRITSYDVTIKKFAIVEVIFRGSHLWMTRQTLYGTCCLTYSHLQLVLDIEYDPCTQAITLKIHLFQHANSNNMCDRRLSKIFKLKDRLNLYLFLILY